MTGQRCLDVGQSSGGFTDCLLQRGAAQVVGVDVGQGQLHPKLRVDERVVCIEKCNARELTAQQLVDAAGEKPPRRST
ncbi:16S/23S rRNA (cytidine-2'-O)-methyltransferase TlyA [Hydrogenophaga sp. T4]|nr:16S/23S rRNA (cytidine-2'-O)-methyltransferase TlyA [Hydrogenophaga sp. T4]